MKKIEENPCNDCYLKYVCSNILSNDCPTVVKKEYPQIWDKQGKLKPVK